MNLRLVDSTYLFRVDVVSFGRVLCNPKGHTMGNIHSLGAVNLCRPFLVRQHTFPFMLWNMSFRRKCIKLPSLTCGVRYIKREAKEHDGQSIFRLAGSFLRRYEAVVFSHFMITVPWDRIPHPVYELRR
jgi:hypothetical protein